MSFLHRLFRHTEADSKTDWLFVLPSLVLLAFFGIPLLALILRAVDTNFFAYALSP